MGLVHALLSVHTKQLIDIPINSISMVLPIAFADACADPRDTWFDNPSAQYNRKYGGNLEFTLYESIDEWISNNKVISCSLGLNLNLDTFEILVI